MIDALSKAVFGTLAGSATLKRVASRYGMRGQGGFARRFVAGETIDEAIGAARAVEAQGLAQTLDLLGESVASEAEARAAAEAYLAMMPRIADAGVGRNISIKLTQLGLDLSADLAGAHLRRILARAGELGFFVRIDMENSPYIEATLALFESVWREGTTNVGVVLQSALKRSKDDLERVLALGARVRLVKGAYKEPAAVAYQSKAEVDDAYVRLMERLLRAGHFPAIATHDPDMIAAARRLATEAGVPQGAYEFQMLYGVRRDLQQSLRAEGFGMRVYIPYGREWFPYFMRRLGERPANVGFVLKSLLRER
ncbi:proline dehydrogenase [Luteitalea sp. TBR-22]|uniref:proline dehydrogenase family protein n=1 Tax=Luteitalea sp. TBR-22 TaxID=2802971 RepID=UPI001AF779AB|nr:proline dehydrogenase family protein [Luteitalea sp. TBR-22]BCS35309.1 proline dehydrogenase [Luteitalea sp. TBR-22]